MSALNQRFDALEDRLGSALADVATRSDVEGLRLVEAHINELTAQLGSIQSQLSRLDSIDDQLRGLNKKLSDDEILRLFGSVVPTDRDLSRYADEAAEKAAQRFAAQVVPAAVVSTPSFAQDQLASSDQLSALHDLLSGFVEERRRNDAQTADALDTMQHAMQHVLDRVDAIDQGPLIHDNQSRGFADDRIEPQLSPVNTRPAHVPLSDEPEPARSQSRSFADEAKAAARAAAAERPAPPEAQVDVARRVEPEFTRTTRASTAAYQPPSAEPAEPPGDRRAFIALARQAAERAKVELQIAEAAAKPSGSGKAAGFKERLFGGGAKDDSNKPETNGGVRPGILMVASVAAFLLAGYWFVAGPKGRSVPISAPIERGAPATPAAAPEVEPVATKAATPSTAAPETVPQKSVVPAPAPSMDPAKPAPKKRSKPETGVDELSENRDPGPAIRTQETASVDGTVIQGPGIAVQATSRPMTIHDVVQARQRAQMASLSERTALNAASTSAIPASLAPSDFGGADASDQQAAAPTVNQTADGRTVLELPPAPIGPLSLRLAAAKGDPSAQFEIAVRFAEGKGVKQDFEQAATWYQRAATQGLAVAQYRLATLYERGLGIKGDPARARVWYARAAAQGNVKAMHNLAVLSAGRGASTPDYPAAAQWFGEAAERGLADSQYNLGVLHESGLGVPKDFATAYKWYALAAQAGDKEAVRRRDLLKPRLDSVSLQAAEQKLEGWRPRAIEHSANDAKATGEAWKGRAQPAPGATGAPG